MEEKNCAIYLIDNDPIEVRQIAKNIFPSAWKVGEESGIETHIGLFGDMEGEHYVHKHNIVEQHSLMESVEEEIFIREIEDILYQLCVTYEAEQGIGLNSEECVLYDKKVKLIDDKIHFIYRSDGDWDAVEEYKKICKEWGSLCAELLYNEKDKFLSSLVDERRKQAALLPLRRMAIPEGACVGIQLALLDGDIERVRFRHQPVISMELYSILRKTYDCFLYSRYPMGIQFVPDCKEVYKKHYWDEEEPDICKNAMLSQRINQYLIN